MEREVIVVGAGPAGATVAMELAQRGHDVLLLDKSRFPRRKVCGDGILSHAIDILDELGAGDPIRKAGFYPIHGSRHVSPRGIVVDLESHGVGYTAPRHELDTLLLRHAVASGAEFRRARVRRPILSEGRIAGVVARIKGEDHRLRARVVLDAGGVVSPLSRNLRRDKPDPAHRALAVRAYVDGLKTLPNRSEFYSLGPPAGGYAWVFPMGETRANVGVGLRLYEYRRHGLNLTRMLAEFLDRPEIRKRLEKNSRVRDVTLWPLDCAVRKGVRRAFSGAVLLGDAAALIDPLDGGGILNAFLSARLAGAVVHKALLAGDVGRRSLKRYEEMCHRVIVRRMFKRYLQARLISTFPFVLDWIMKAADRNNRIAERYVAKSYNVRSLLETTLGSADL